MILPSKECLLPSVDLNNVFSFFKDYVFIYVCMYVYVCVCVSHMCRGTQRGKKKTLGTLELELELERL